MSNSIPCNLDSNCQCGREECELQTYLQEEEKKATGRQARAQLDREEEERHPFLRGRRQEEDIQLRKEVEGLLRWATQEGFPAFRTRAREVLATGDRWEMRQLLVQGGNWGYLYRKFR